MIDWELTKEDYITSAKLRPTIKGEHFLNIIESLVSPLSDIEDVFIELAKLKDLDTVEDVWLTYLGEALGEPRDGRSDEDYRAAIRIAISIDYADTTPASISSIIKSFTGSERITLAEGYFESGQVICQLPTYKSATTREVLDDITPVTAHLDLLIDEEGDCFRPAWKVPKLTITELEVRDSGTVEDLSVRLNTTPIIDTLYMREGEGGFDYTASSVGHEVLGWRKQDGTLETVTPLLIKIKG